MFKRFFKRYRDLLPWYVNATLSEEDSNAVEKALKQDPEARTELESWQMLQSVVTDQTSLEPNRMLRQKILANVRVRTRQGRLAYARSSTVLNLMMGAGLTIAFLLLLWGTIRPGIILQWSVSGGPLTSFEIYRAPLGSQDYQLVRSVTAQSDQVDYTYVDSFLVPGRTYVYRVEGLGSGGSATISQSITSDSKDVLLGQLVILFASLSMGISAVMLVKSWPLYFPMRMGSSTHG